MKLTAHILTADIPNKNGRVYSKAVCEDIVKQLKEMYQPVGEFNPDSGSAHINLAKVSHSIENPRMEGNNLVADFKLLDTPSGWIAKTLKADGYDLQFASRGVGVVDPITGIVSDYKIICVDIVKDKA